LRQLLDRLDSEQQVFILRRSAGFAYSFLSLMRSESSNCKPTLLPTAMRVLLKCIERGLEDIPSTGDAKSLKMFSEQNSDGGDMEAHAASWRICVHALNVIRMILIDSALSPELDTFIAESTELAVRGFQSRHWAVRCIAFNVDSHGAIALPLDFLKPSNYNLIRLARMLAVFRSVIPR
jgi:Putative death-receptor fusion protein (DUF2428)